MPASPQAMPWSAWLRVESGIWLFVAKTLLAAMFAVWIAFRLDLDSPRTALVTVFIVSLPQAGAVLAKSFFRLLGTLVGCAVTLVLVSLFAQQRELFIVALTVWVGLCAAGSAGYRNFRAYGFVLSGYTACLIGIPAAQHPEAAFYIAVSRVTEVSLGILCAGFAADLVLPQRLTSALTAAVRGNFREFLGFAAAVLDTGSPAATPEALHGKFVANAIAIEAQRDSAYFESAYARVRSNGIRLLNSRFMLCTSTLHRLQQLRRRTQGAGASLAARDAVTPLCRALAYELSAAAGPLPNTAAEAAGLEARLSALSGALPARIRLARDCPEVGTTAIRLLDYDCCAGLLLRLTGEMRDLTSSYAALAAGRRVGTQATPKYLPHFNVGLAALMGLRAMLVVGALCALWIAAAWPSAVSAIQIAAVNVCLFAAVPAPTLAARKLAAGFFWGMTAAFLCSFAILPRMDGFVLFAASLLPFLMMGSWLMANPRTAALGTGFGLAFSVVVSVDNVARFDPVGFVNDGMGILGGSLAAIVAFALVVPPDSRVLSWYRTVSLRRQGVLACRGRLSGLRGRFDNRTRDLLGQSLISAGPTSPEGGRLMALALCVLELGHSAIDLREQVAATNAGAAQRRLPECLRTLGRLFGHATAAHRDALLRVIDRMAADLDADAARTRPVALALRNLQIIAADADVVKQLCAHPSPEPGEPTSHAA